MFRHLEWRVLILVLVVGKLTLRIVCGCCCTRKSATHRHHHLELVDSHPRVLGKVLHHGHQKHEAARPVADQQHQRDKLDYLDEGVGHVQELYHVGAVVGDAVVVEVMVVVARARESEHATERTGGTEREKEKKKEREH